jgi:hypothetical protein
MARVRASERARAVIHTKAWRNIGEDIVAGTSMMARAPIQNHEDTLEAIAIPVGALAA